MRCITAICPAGPPKESAAIRAHVAKASRHETDESSGEVVSAAMLRPSQASRTRRLGRSLNGGSRSPCSKRAVRAGICQHGLGPAPASTSCAIMGALPAQLPARFLGRLSLLGKLTGALEALRRQKSLQSETTCCCLEV